MQFVRILRTVGTLCFVIAWIPFALMFVGLGVESLGFLALPMGVMMGILFGVAVISLVLTPILGGLANQSVLRDGIDATATILKISDTGTGVNDNPLVRFMLEVHAPGYPPFHAEVEQIISRVQIGMFQPGATLPVRCDPEKKRVAIVKGRLPDARS